MAINVQPEIGSAFDYPVRTSEVGSLYVISSSNSSVIQVGDLGQINATLRALAVHREINHLEAGETYFESYPIFSRPLPMLIDPAEEQIDAVIRTTNKSPRICVGCIDVTAISSSAAILIGNGMNARGESRIKDIRQFARPRA